MYCQCIGKDFEKNRQGSNFTTFHFIGIYENFLYIEQYTGSVHGEAYMEIRKKLSARNSGHGHKVGKDALNEKNVQNFHR